MAFQKGFLLIEAMVALAVFSIAILGLLVAQGMASRYQFQTLLRTEAIIHAHNLHQAIRANTHGAETGEYTLSETNIRDLAPWKAPMSSSQAKIDLHEWATFIHHGFKGRDTSIEIQCASIARPCSTRIHWSNPGASYSTAGTSQSHFEIIF